MKENCFDFKCIDCEHPFDVSDGELIKDVLCCPKCKSENLLDLEDLDAFDDED